MILTNLILQNKINRHQYASWKAYPELFLKNFPDTIPNYSVLPNGYLHIQSLGYTIEEIIETHKKHWIFNEKS